MSEEEDWLKAAVADDSLVVQLLLQISHASPPPPKSLPPLHPPIIPLRWSVRQRRSKPISLKSSAATARASPTTPLSWSAATSHSGGFEESSQPPPRSNNKVSETSEAIRPKKRKRKTKIELKEEEAGLLKERKNLKKKIATMRVTLKEERATNESLKRMKIELTMKAAAKGANDFESVEPDSKQTLDMLAASDANPSVLPQSVISNGTAALPELVVQDSYLEVRKEVANYENKFALPDLNVALVESDAEILHVMS